MEREVVLHQASSAPVNYPRDAGSTPTTGASRHNNASQLEFEEDHDLMDDLKRLRADSDGVFHCPWDDGTRPPCQKFFRNAGELRSVLQDMLRRPFVWFANSS